MFRHRCFVALVVAAGLVTVAAAPAHAAEVMKSKSVTGPNGRYGALKWYQERSGGKVSNWVMLTADDKDGPGGKCTETWVDYSTKPHEHWNPGVFVNCKGGRRTIKAMTSPGKTIRGISLIVCEVPNTSGRIVRNKSNCRGQIGSLYLHSGQRYSRFDVSAAKHPSGIRVYKA